MILKKNFKSDNKIQYPNLSNIIPLITTIVASIFTALLLWQFSQRQKIHQGIWTFAMALYALSAFMEYLANPDILGANTDLIKIYYASAGPLVGLLGSGVLYLLVRKKIANIYLGIVIILSFALLIGTATSDLNQEGIKIGFQENLAEGFREASTSFTFFQARIFMILLNSTGGIFLVGGALYSYVRDRSRFYNIPLLLGGLFPSLGGTLLGILDNPDVFFEFELAGTIFLFIGFVMSMGYLRRKK